MAKVLWISDGGCTTGFGRVTHSIGERLVDDYGHEIHVLATNYRGDPYPSLTKPGRRTQLELWRPTTLSPKDAYGQSRIVELLGNLEPDVVVMLNDANIVLEHLFSNPYDSNRFLLQARPILLYLPVDGTNLPPGWPGVLTKVTNVVAMSKWGQSLYPGSKLVYHGIDADVFHPVSKDHPIELPDGTVLRSKRDCKKAFGFNPSGFVIGRVDSNSGRKDYGSTWKALAPVMKRHKDIEVHFHCQEFSPGHGVNLPVLFTREPEIDPKRFFFPGMRDTHIGWSEPELVALYNAFDLFVTTSRGEGFGLTNLEAISCGVPVVAQNVAATPEVVGPGGVLIEPRGLLTVPNGEDEWLADTEAFTEAIERLYRSAGARRSLSEAGREHAKTFSWDVAAQKFDGYIRALAAARPSSDTSEEAPPDDTRPEGR